MNQVGTPRMVVDLDDVETQGVVEADIALLVRLQPPHPPLAVERGAQVAHEGGTDAAALEARLHADGTHVPVLVDEVVDGPVGPEDVDP